jgi:Tfp pilus assembly protein PilN
MMRRPNLSAHPFLDVRPVWVAGGALAVVALVLSTVSVAELVRERRTERAAAAKLTQLQARRTELTAKVEAANRKLAAVPWKKLQGETESLQGVVARRRLVWSQLLGDLERVVPWDIRLVSIAPTVGKEGEVRVAISGIATGREAWLKLLAVLFTDRSFSDPLPSSEDAPSASNSQGYKFVLAVNYWPGGRP